MKPIQLNLTLDDINLILEGLGNLPFIKVHDLINTIHSQANTQMAEAETALVQASKNASDNVTRLASEK